MSVQWPKLLIVLIILLIHYKYVTLWSETGGFRHFWSGWDGDSSVKKLSKVSFITAVGFALIAVVSTYPLPLFGCAMLALLVHGLTLVAVNE
jgi:hypothetical protein